MKEIDDINDMMSEFAPKLEVRAVDLPVLTNTTEDPQVSIVQQLGVFTKEDIAPGEVILHETSMITANNKLQDALCDACSGELPELDSDDADKIVTCRHCEVVFCSEYCHYHAQQEYHPALCGRDVEAIAKNVPASEAADSLYALLLLRTYAMARTMELENPLQLCEVRYLWGDFHNLNIEENWRAVGEGPKHSNIPRTLPFSFENNVKLPYHLLEKMDIDIFAGPHYDVWIFNTLYAKFRGTASARLSGSSGGVIRGPEVSAVHPMWCLANHSCDPNVSWEWGGSIKLWAREERPVWQKDGQSNRMTRAGIAKGKEVLNHYCDINLPVNERREWARGALGGDCQCARCKWEADEAPCQR